MRTSLRLTTALCLASLVFGVSRADAKDALQAAVSIQAGQPVPLMAENGNGYTPGTYAVGTIILNYTYVGTSFPAGMFAAFDLNMKVYDATTRNEPVYPVLLTLEDIGSKHLELWPAMSPVSMTGLGWSLTNQVVINIPSNVATNPEFMADGAQIVGNLRMTTPGGSGVDTVTNVLVKITLVHPSGPCLRIYSFVTDTGYGEMLTGTDVNVNRQGKVNSTNPHGSLSSNAMVVNTCGFDVTFDIRMTLDGSFSTQPANNPGNAVRTFITGTELDPTTFDIAAFGAGTMQGQKLCLQNVTVPDGSTFLDAVHMSINNGMLVNALPADANFDFSASLYAPGTACSGALLAEAGVAPTVTLLPFNIK